MQVSIRAGIYPKHVPGAAGIYPKYGPAAPGIYPKDGPAAPGIYWGTVRSTGKTCSHHNGGGGAGGRGAFSQQEELSETPKAKAGRTKRSLYEMPKAQRGEQSARFTNCRTGARTSSDAKEAKVLA